MTETDTDPDTDETGDEDGGEPTNRIDDIVEELSVDEKIDLVHGSYDPDERATGYVAANERVGTPSMSLVDGPMGVRAVTATAFPASIALASSWDTDLAADLGGALAREVRGADQDGLLAPGFNIVRVPQCGRAFEYYSEDPTLASRLAVNAVTGVQDNGVLATAKHYVANNQEADRHFVDAQVSERALREIYLPAFEAAVKEADVGSVMAAYNRINGTYAAHHRYLLTEVLKDEWGFDGFVVSDWWATHDGVAAAEGGLDLDMPGLPLYAWHEDTNRILEFVGSLPDEDWIPKRTLAELGTSHWQPPNPNPNILDESPFDEPLRAAVADGRVEEADLDEKVRRVLGQMERFGLFEDDQPEGAIDTPEHRELARQIAERGTVLLDNDGTLPLDAAADVALVGPDADAAKVGGGGSSEVDAARTVSPLDGVRERLGATGTVTFERGVPSVGDASLHGSILPDASDVLSGDGEPRIEEAMATARDADVAVVVVRDAATEGADRALELPGAQNELITAVAAEAERTVVVLNTAGMVRMPWLDDVDAVVETWYPGQEDGRALASVLFGDVDPGGRLPVTFARRPADYPPSTEAEYPGVDREVEYNEGVFVGYRHFDEEEIDPLFPFGHGLSYAEFEYGDCSVDLEDGDGPTATVEVTVENVGDREGREVVQAYLGEVDPAVERPPKELAAFESVALDAGEERTVALEIDRRAFAYYDEDAGEWTVDPGEFEVLVGRSSRDVRAEETVEVEA